MRDDDGRAFNVPPLLNAWQSCPLRGVWRSKDILVKRVRCLKRERSLAAELRAAGQVLPLEATVER